MRDQPDDLYLDRVLRDGLGALPVPDPSPDFDARVLLALRAPQPWWQRLWQPARPLLLGASCSLAVTLVLLHWTLSAPVAAPSAPALAAAPSRAPSLDAVLDRADLRAGSLAAAWGSPLATNPGGTGSDSPSDRRPDPPRHAQVGRRVALVA